MRETIHVPELRPNMPLEVGERVKIMRDILNTIFAALNKDGMAVMVANNFSNENDTQPLFMTLTYMNSKRIRIQIEKASSTNYRIDYGVLSETASNDSLDSNYFLTQQSSYAPTGTAGFFFGLITVVTSSVNIIINYRGYAQDGSPSSSSFDYGTVLSGYTAKHMITGNRVMLINDMLPGSDVAVSGSTTQGIAIPRPSTLLAPQSDIMYSIPIINPSGDDAGFTGYFAEGKFVFSNIHEYPVGTTVNIEGKLYSVIEKNYVAPLED